MIIVNRKRVANPVEDLNMVVVIPSGSANTAVVDQRVVQAAAVHLSWEECHN